MSGLQSVNFNKGANMNIARHTSVNLLGNNSRVDDGSELIPPVRLYGKVIVDAQSCIGKYTYIGSGTYVTNASIGSYCSIARGAEIGTRAHPLGMLSTHPFQYNLHHFTGQPGYNIARTPLTQIMKKTGTAIIGSDVWIGTKAIIKGGIKIGHGAVIGAGSVVTKDVRPYAIVAGVPAKELRRRFDDETIEKLLESKWWDMDPIDMDGINFSDIDTALAEIKKRKLSYASSFAQDACSEINNIIDSNNGIIWFDINKSYLFKYFFVDKENVEVICSPFGNGVMKIKKIWFNEKINAFGLRVDKMSDKIIKNSVIFRFL